MLETHHYLRLFFPYSSGFEHLIFIMIAVGLLVRCRAPGPWLSWANVDRLLIFAWVPLGDYETGPLARNSLIAWLLLVPVVVRLVQRARRPPTPPPPAPGPDSGNGTVLLTVGAVLAVSGLVMISPIPYAPGPSPGYRISDSAAAGIAGARLVLKGRPVYGNTRSEQENPKRNMGWDTYGPSYYYTFTPFEALYGTSQDPKKGYGLSARITTIALHVLGTLLAGLVGLRIGGPGTGRLFALVWAACPYAFVTTYWCSLGHYLPGVYTLLAILGLLHGPVCAGLALGWLGAAAFYPVFFIPVWVMAFRGRARVRFLVTVILCGGLVSLPQFLQDEPVRRFLDATVVWQENYGNRPWSPWTHWPELIPLRAFLSLMFLPVIAACSAAVGRLGPGAVIPMTGVVVAWVELYKLHAPGRYTMWIFPLLLTAFLPGRPLAPPDEDLETGQPAAESDPASASQSA